METSNINLQVQPSAATIPQSEIPQLSTATVATFEAFKELERFSFIRNYSPTVVAIPGYRHCVIRYRVTGTDKAEKPAKLVTIPQLVLPAEYQQLDERARKVILGVFEDEQDNIVRGLIDAQASKILWESVELNKVLDSLTAVRISQRLTKQGIEAWAKVAFVEYCNNRADEISKQKGYNDEQQKKQRAGTLNAYCELAMTLAAPVPNIGQGQATTLQTMLTKANLDDDMAKVLKGKLHAILNPQVTENADL